MGLGLDAWWDEPASKTCNTFHMRGMKRGRVLRRLRREGIGLAVPARRIHLSTNDGSVVHGGDGRLVAEGRSAE